MNESMRTEEPDASYKCLAELKEYRGYIPASIELGEYGRLQSKLERQCRVCQLKKELGFCAVKDELIEIRDNATEVQKHTAFMSPSPFTVGLMGYSKNRISGVTNPMRTNRRHW